MTIAISMKVNDGVILACDSAATILQLTTDGQALGVVNVYYNADKIFNLCKGKPIGAITWGSGSIGSSTISTLIKDFRKILTDEQFCKNDYSMEEIARRFATFLFEERYQPAFSGWNKKPNIGFIVAGYSSPGAFAEEWKIEIIDGILQGPNTVRGNQDTGITWSGEPEAITRLMLGFGTNMPTVLFESGLDQKKVDEIMVKIHDKLKIPLVLPPLPIQDAIELAEFLAMTTINFSKYTPGPTTVGGPVDIAVITKHEGFKWVKRKHYFNNELNPNNPQ